MDIAIQAYAPWKDTKEVFWSNSDQWSNSQEVARSSLATEGLFV
jgi:hypothetical protein